METVLPGDTYYYILGSEYSIDHIIPWVVAAKAEPGSDV
jgi:hypothetical protein